MRVRAAALLLALSAVALAAPAHASEDGELDAVGHTGDGNYWDFSPLGKWQLPRLFVVRDADGALGVDAFWTSKAAVASGLYRIAVPHGDGDGNHGPAAHAVDPRAEDSVAAERDEADGDLTVEEFEEANQEALLGAGVESEGSPYASPLERTNGEVLLDLSITRHLLFALFAIGLLLLLLLPMAGKYTRGVGRTSAPRGLLMNTVETIVVYVRDEIAKPNLGEKTDRYLPYLLTVFFFILTCNLLGLLPFGATATANITSTTVLALFTFVITQFAGTKDYWRHIFWPPGIPWYVNLILVPIEILGLFTKPFALAVRLFANMTAGHLVILNLIGLIFVIGGAFGDVAGYGTSIPALGLTLFIYALEILVAFIQAYVFTILSALFIGMATAEHEHDHDHSEDHGITAHDIAVSRSNGQSVHKDAERTVGTEAVLA